MLAVPLTDHNSDSFPDRPGRLRENTRYQPPSPHAISHENPHGNSPCNPCPHRHPSPQHRPDLFSLSRADRIRPSGTRAAANMHKAQQGGLPTGLGSPGLQVGRATITCRSGCGSTSLAARHGWARPKGGGNVKRFHLMFGERRVRKNTCIFQPLLSLFHSLEYFRLGIIIVSIINYLCENRALRIVSVDVFSDIIDD